MIHLTCIFAGQRYIPRIGRLEIVGASVSVLVNSLSGMHNQEIPWALRKGPIPGRRVNAYRPNSKLSLDRVPPAGDYKRPPPPRYTYIRVAARRNEPHHRRGYLGRAVQPVNISSHVGRAGPSGRIRPCVCAYAWTREKRKKKVVQLRKRSCRIPRTCSPGPPHLSLLRMSNGIQIYWLPRGFFRTRPAGISVALLSNKSTELWYFFFLSPMPGRLRVAKTIRCVVAGAHGHVKARESLRVSV